MPVRGGPRKGLPLADWLTGVHEQTVPLPPQAKINDLKTARLRRAFWAALASKAGLTYTEYMQLNDFEQGVFWKTLTEYNKAVEQAQKRANRRRR